MCLSISDSGVLDFENVYNHTIVGNESLDNIIHEILCPHIIFLDQNINWEAERNMSIYGCDNAFVLNSRQLFSANSSYNGVITVYNIKMENTVIILNGIYTIFVRCTFQNVCIKEGFSKKSNAIDRKKVFIYKSSLSCPSSNELLSCITLDSGSIVEILIAESVFQYCTIDVIASGLISTIRGSSFTNVFLKIGVKSHFKIPALIRFQQSQFRHNDAVPVQNLIELDLFNPYITIDNCTFIKASFNIISKQHYFQQHLFAVKIIGSQFINSSCDRNGGAMSVISEVINSTLLLSNVLFRHNKAGGSLNAEPGKGGAVFVEGDNLNLIVSNCILRITLLMVMELLCIHRKELLLPSLIPLSKQKSPHTFQNNCYQFLDMLMHLT